MTDTHNICHLTSVHTPFDTRIFHKECRSLALAGYEVHLVARHPREETIEGIYLHPVPDRPNKLRRTIFTTWDVYRQARRIDADLYHFHDPELIPVGVLLKLSGKKVIEDVHENFPDYIRNKDNIPRPFGPFLAWATGLVERLTAGLFDAVIVVVPVIYDRFRPLNPRTVSVRNFPLLDELTPVRRVGGGGGETAGIPTVAYIGNITRDRGIVEMIQAMERVNRTHPVRLVIGGTFAPPSLMDDVEGMAGYKFVDYRGFLNRGEVSRVLGEARAGLVVPLPYSHNMQGYMNKLFEYMSAGLPVIASDFPQWRPIVGETACGVMVDSGDPTAIAGAIQELLDHPDEAVKMGQRGRQAVEEKYNWETEKAALLDLYRTLLG